MKLNHETVRPDFLSNVTLTPLAFRLFYAISKTQPANPAVGVCLEGDTTLRLVTTVALFRAGRINHVIVSGGVEDDDDLDERPAAKMKEYLITKGIPEEVIDVEQQSRTTHEHPLYVNAIARQRGAKDLMIITSGYHLLRAYLRFLRELSIQGYPYALYGYPAGSFPSWFQRIPNRGPYRFLTLLSKELAKISTYEGLATFDEAWQYIHSLKSAR